MEDIKSNAQPKGSPPTTNPPLPIERLAWIEDENMLRDEGVLFGLAGSNYEDKVKTIQTFFQQKIAVLEAGIDSLFREIENSRMEIKSSQGLLLECKDLIEDLSTRPEYKEHQFYRSLARFVAFSVIVLFNYYVIYEWLGQSWEYSIPVSLGIYFLGNFSLFLPQSILYTSDKEAFQKEREKWKTLLEEYGIPLAATAFTVTWGNKEANISEIMSFAILLFFLFLFSGKGWLGSIMLLKSDFQTLRLNWLNSRFRLKKIKDSKLEVQKLENAIKERENLIINLEKEISQKQEKIQEHTKEMELKVNYFLSELRLASATKEALSSEQLLRWGLNKRDAHG